MDAALQRVADATTGTCEDCGQAITIGRGDRLRSDADGGVDEPLRGDLFADNALGSGF
jgi:hypothetical protein